ncbi:MAG TPA: ribonuclease R [Thermoanaerobaculia bacterium]|nr:ribonuclease R [Thermoanaerobaculia bacterium]
MSIEFSRLSGQILDLLRQKGNRVLAVKEIHDRLNDAGGAADRDDVERVVEHLERTGEIAAIRGKRYSLLEFTPFRAGRIRISADGVGFVYGEGDKPDLYIDRKNLKGAMNGDLVLVRTDPRRQRHKTIRKRDYFEAEVSRVLQREHRTVVGRFHAGEPPYVRPFDERLDEDVEIDPRGTMGARDLEMVNVEIERYPGGGSIAAGRVVETLGMLGEPGVDIEVVIRKYHIAHRFPDAVLAAAEEIPQEIDPAEIAKRVDLRDRTIVTIDGETAKDFDDAVEVTQLDNGNYRLGVHIADVSYYVTEGSILDREALERATSVYFPGRAVPMLPERLSNGICSLNPQVDRLTFSAEIEIDSRGRFVDRKLFRSVIRTAERMTYTEVHALLTDPSPELSERYAPLIEDFRRMHDLYEILRKRRDARGSIDFDLPESEILLGELGEIEAILPSSRNVAHRLIEEFMLAANEVVAEHLQLSAQPAIYRIHMSPDAQRIEDLKKILQEFGHKLRAQTDDLRPGELQRVLATITGTPEERFLTELVLRSMKRALYSEENLGHFALALQFYCHFTSPIRRYPDLVIHRMLGQLLEKGALFGEQLDAVTARIPQIASQSSDREKRAEDAEREVIEWKKVLFMRDKVGEEFSGRITGVTSFGLFIELEEVFVQGLAPISTIGGDFWQFLEREHRLRGEQTEREFRLGDPVRVEIHEVDEDRRQISFRLLESGGTAVEERTRGTRRPATR